MTNTILHRYKLLTWISLFSFSIPLYFYILWIYVFDLGSTQPERVIIYHNYFPEFLHGRWDVTFLSILLCTSAVLIAAFSLMKSNGIWKLLNILTILFAGMLLILNLFSMM